MEFPEYMGLKHPIYIEENGHRVTLPDWAKGAIWLGWWCRKLQLEHKRILTVAVLPARNLSAAFAGLGCLVAGAEEFRGGLTWEEFSTFPPSTEIFWRPASGGQRHGGVILETDPSYPNLVPLRVTSGLRKRIDTWFISSSTFKDYLFSEENLPTQHRTEAIGEGLQFYSGVGIEINPRWAWTAGAEAQIVTNQTQLGKALAELKICAQGGTYVLFEKVLCTSREEDQLAKLRVLSVGHPILKKVPVTILDGEAAFDKIYQIESGNILMILERSEYSAELHNFLLEFNSFSEVPPPEALHNIPSSFPAGMELTAFVASNIQ